MNIIPYFCPYCEQDQDVNLDSEDYEGPENVFCVVCGGRMEEIDITPIDQYCPKTY